MAKDKIVFDEMAYEKYRNKLIWFLPEDDDFGAVIGDDLYTEQELASAKSDDRPHMIATITAGKTADVERDLNGYHWPTKAKAEAALRAINAALKNDTGAPMPDWAVKASAAGWKAPKGWKP